MQQEPLITAALSDDEHMKNAFIQGKDIYSTIAALAFNQPYEECKEFREDGSTNVDGKERRSQAKSIVLGILYGRSIITIAEQLNTTKEKAQEIYNNVLAAFPKLHGFMIESQDMARKLGYVTTIYGRRRHIPNMMLKSYEFTCADGSSVTEEIESMYTKKLDKSFYFTDKQKIKDGLAKQGITVKENTNKIKDAERQCVNSRVQGSAADVVKKAMIAVHNDAVLNNLNTKIILQIHDELIVECPTENAKQVAERLSELMINAARDKITIPMRCDTEITQRWYGEPLKL